MYLNSLRGTEKTRNPMTILHQILRRITTTRHSRALEDQIAQQRTAIASQQNEIARLRAENRALLNSILGIAGIPPILVDSPLPSSVSLPAKCHSESAAADDESLSAPSFPSSTTAEKNSPGTQSPRNDIPPQSSFRQSFPPPSAHPSLHSSAVRSSFPPSPAPRRRPATPLRRRSWHQITRALELESGKKKSG